MTGAAATTAPQHAWRVGRDRVIQWRGCLVMGILNVTPDSFSDGGQLPDVAATVAAGRAMIADGAHVLDIGGESTRPGAAPVTAADEARRALPAVTALATALPGTLLSIDTSKSVVADAALAAGAHIVNDVRGGRDSRMAGVVARHDAGFVLMRDGDCQAEQVVADAAAQLATAADRARQGGVLADAIVVDPGLGFGKLPGSDVVANLALIDAGAAAFGGRPVLIGASRKRFVGEMAGEVDAAAPARIAMSVEVAVRAAQAGAAIVRVHDVPETVAGLAAAGCYGSITTP